LNALGRAVRRIGLPYWKTRKISLQNSEPIVSFTFDDFPRTALTNGGQILATYNARGTYYTAMGLLDTFNHEGQHFCLQDLHDLLRDGHELASHTYSHCSALENSLARFSSDAERGESEAAKIRGNGTAGNFSYPYGNVTFSSKPALGTRMRSCRGIRPGINAPFADLNLLLANNIYSHNFNLASFEQLLQGNQRQRGWLIFYTHDVRETPSDFGCTPVQLESVLRLAAKSGAQILTVARALDTLQAIARTDAAAPRSGQSSPGVPASSAPTASR